MAMKRAIVIDAHKQEIREEFVGEKESLAFMQTIVGGFIERAVTPSRDVDLYVDEEGLLKNPTKFFRFEGCEQPYAGNGVICGGKFAKNATLDEVRAKVRFFEGSVNL